MARRSGERARTDGFFAEPLEPRVLYSADALGALAPFVAEEAIDPETIGWRAEDYAADAGPDGDGHGPEDERGDGRGDGDVVRDATVVGDGTRLAIVDASVPDRHALVEALHRAGLEVVGVGANEDGLDVVGTVLEGRTGVAEVHVFAHGADGEMRLGSSVIDGAALEASAPDVTAWGGAFAGDADLLLHACDLAGGADGRALVDRLARLTGLDVAASDDVTGSAALGGDWALEVRSGDIDPRALAIGAALDAWQGTLATVTLQVGTHEDTMRGGITVTNANATSGLSLREAVQAVNTAGDTGDDYVIRLQAGTYRLTLEGADETATSGDLDIDSSLTILGTGYGTGTGASTDADVDESSRTTILQATSDRVIDLNFMSGERETLVLRDLVIEGGASGDGAGLVVGQDRAASLEGVLFVGNSASADGGAIWSRGYLDVSGSRFEDNLAGSRGGAVSAGDEGLGTLVVSDSSFESNGAKDGGALFANATDAMLEGNVFFDNTASGTGGGIYSRASLSVERSTFVGNSDAEHGGAIVMKGGTTLALSDTMFLDNLSDDGAHRGIEAKDVVSGGHNLFQQEDLDKSDKLKFANGLLATDIVLAPGFAVTDVVVRAAPADGPITWTLPAGSPAINGGSSAGTGATALDGAVRDAMPDIGAVESRTMAETVFWADDRGSLLRMGMDMRYGQEIVLGGGGGANAATDIEIDLVGGNLYWVDNRGGRLLTAGLDGDGTRVLSNSILASITGIAIDAAGQRLYLSMDDGILPASIGFLDLGTPADTSVTLLSAAAMNLQRPADLAFDPARGRLTWAEGNGAVRSASPTGPAAPRDERGAQDGSGLSDIVVDPGARRALVADADNDRFIAVAAPRVEEVTLVEDLVDVAHAPVTDAVVVASPGGFMTLSENASTPSAIYTGAPAFTGDVTAIAIGVTGVDTTPVVSGDGTITLEQARSVTLDTGTIGATDAVHAGPEHLVWTVEALPAEGTLAIRGTDAASLPVPDRWFTQSELDAGEVGYTASADASPGDRLLGLSLSDGANAAVPFEVTITVIQPYEPISVDAGAGPFTVMEGDFVVLDAGFVTADAGGDPDLVTLAVDPADGMEHGVLVLVDPLDPSRDGPVIGAFTLADLSAGHIRYVHDAAGEDVPGEAFGLRVTDANESPAGEHATLVRIDVTNVQDAPTLVIDPVARSVAENAPTVLRADWFAVGDDDADQDDDDLRYTVASRGDGTEIEVGGVPSDAASFTHAQLVAGDVSYLRNGLEPGTGASALRLTVADDAGLVSPTRALNLSVVADNDAPTIGASAAVDVVEHAEAVITVDQLAIDDVDTPDEHLVYTVSAAQLPAHGRLVLRDGVGGESAATRFDHADVAAGRLVYVQDERGVADTPGDVFGYTLGDRGADGTDTGGAVLTGSVDVAIGNVGDAPAAASPGALAAPENGVVALGAAHLTAVDDDVADGPAELRWTPGAMPAGATLRFGADPGDPEAGTFTQARVEAGEVHYHHGGGERGAMPGGDRIELTLADGAGTGDPAVVRLDVDVRTDNDAPTIGASAAVDVVEHAEAVITVDQLAIDDVDTPDEHLVYTVSAAQLPAHGRLVLRDGVGGESAATRFDHADVAAGRLVYVQDERGVADTPGDVFGYTLGDRGADGTDTGGAVLTGSVDVAIGNVGDAPAAASPGALAAPENGVVALGAAHLTAVDDDVADGPAELRWTPGAMPAGATLRFGADPGDPEAGTFTQARVEAGEVHYHHGGGERGAMPGGDRIELTLADGVGTGDPAVVRLDVDIRAENDAPTLATRDVRVDEGGSAVLDIDAIEAIDEEARDAADLLYEVSVPADAPIRFAASANGPAITVFDGKALATGGVHVVHDGSERLEDITITLTVTDVDGAATTARLGVGVTPVDDGPVLTLPSGPPVVAEHGEVRIDTRFLTIADEDSSVDELRLRVDAGPSHGSLVLRDGIESKRAADTFTYGQLRAGEIVYLQDGLGPDVPSDAFSFTVTDPRDASAAPMSGTVSIAITDAADAPSPVLGATSVAEDGSTVLGPESLLATDDDVDDGPDALAWNVRGLPAGAAVLVDGVPASAFTQAQVNAGRVAYVHGGTEPSAADDVLSLELRDGGGTGEGIGVELHLQVTPVNDAPYVADFASPVTLGADRTTFELPVDGFGDAERDVLTWDATLTDGGQLPGWIAFDGETRRFALLAPDEADPRIDVRLRVSDGNGGESTTVVTLLFDPPVPDVVPEPALAAAGPDAVVRIPLERIEPVPERSDALVDPVPEPVAPASGEGAAGPASATPPAARSIEAPRPASAEPLDMRSLVRPLERTQVLSPDVTAPLDRGDVVDDKARPDDAGLDFAALLALLGGDVERDTADLVDALDREREAIEERASFAQTVIGGSIGISSGLSVGYLIWLIRGGTLATSMLSSLPAWRFVDPLPVLGSLGETGGDGDGESLQSIVADSSSAPSSRSDTGARH